MRISGELHQRGFHPTGLFATFRRFTISRPNCWDWTRKPWRAPQELPEASRADCWSAGWTARRPNSCIRDGRRRAESWRRCWRARDNRASGGFRGPLRFVRFALQDSAHCDYGRIGAGLGDHWESRNSSFKPFPAAHVLHPYISAILRLRDKHRIRPGTWSASNAGSRNSSSASFASRRRRSLRPASDSHGRVSLQYTLAEALTLENWARTPIAQRASAIPKFWRSRGE